MPEDDDRVLDVEDSPYLRRQRQPEVRRSRLNRRTTAGLKKVLLVMAALAVVCLAAWRAVRFGLDDPLFAFSTKHLEIAGSNYVSSRQIAEKFAGDVGRSIFRIPLERRRVMLEEISWIESAAVARVWPGLIRVRVRERVPVAFIKTATGLALIDGQGVVLERPARANFTFPIVTGFSERDTLEARRDRMRVYLALIEDLDRDGGHYSLDISEVDLSDPEDARILVAGRDAHDAVLVHLGNSNFLPRYRTYLAHIAQWRQQFKKIQSVDLRYERQIIVNPDRR
ncbi:MAG: FtsQ-type POTRA domain-containing protein [Acidobacteria bacterium]|jgi:cell division protein FtsQ|nr:FtsQ-type POTRA domain-containing protein [Acidobacteriota bacterium]